MDTIHRFQALVTLTFAVVMVASVIAIVLATPVAAQPRWQASETFPSRDPWDIVAVGDSMLYVATRDLGLLRSDDGGRTWVASQVLRS